MIRYVLAVVLAGALLSVGLPAAEQGAAVNSEGTLDAAASEIEQRSEALMHEEQLPPEGVEGPQRSLTVTFPRGSLTSAPVRQFEIERVPGESYSIVRYRVEGGAEQTTHVDAPILNESLGSPVDLGRPAGETTLVLLLQRDPTDDDRPVVVLTRTSR